MIQEEKQEEREKTPAGSDQTGPSSGGGRVRAAARHKSRSPAPVEAMLGDDDKIPASGNRQEKRSQSGSPSPGRAGLSLRTSRQSRSRRRAERADVLQDGLSPAGTGDDEFPSTDEAAGSEEGADISARRNQSSNSRSKRIAAAKLAVSKKSHSPHGRKVDNSPDSNKMQKAQFSNSEKPPTSHKLKIGDPFMSTSHDPIGLERNPNFDYVELSQLDKIIKLKTKLGQQPKYMLPNKRIVRMSNEPLIDPAEFRFEMYCLLNHLEYESLTPISELAESDLEMYKYSRGLPLNLFAKEVMNISQIDSTRNLVLRREARFPKQDGPKTVA